jgi:Flp pilus assembly protein TadG
MSRHPQQRRRQLGQSLIEVAIGTPVLLTLLLGGFTATTMVSDKVIAGYACRQGVRLAALTGGSQTTTLTTAQVDANIVKNVLAVANGLNYATIKEVDIYAPSRLDGQYTPGDPLDAYNGSGTLIGTATFPVANRNQTPPSETSIGVRLIYQFKPPTAFLSVDLQLSEYAVMKASPVLI